MGVAHFLMGCVFVSCTDLHPWIRRLELFDDHTCAVTHILFAKKAIYFCAVDTFIFTQTRNQIKKKVIEHLDTTLGSWFSFCLFFFDPIDSLISFFLV